MKRTLVTMHNAFALGSFRGPDGDFAGLVRDDRMLDLRPWREHLGITGPVTTDALLARWDDVRDLLGEIARTDDDDWVALDPFAVLPPVRPTQVFQAGANYRTHVLDLVVAHHREDDPRTKEQVRADAAEMMDRRARAGDAYVFIGLTSAITGPFDDVVLPSYSDQHDWELELAAVIGRRTHRVTADEALAHVAGYTIANDLTTRDLVFRRDMPEIGTDWMRAKNAPGFTPLGPWLVPADQVDPDDLRVTLTLNGKVMQDESTKDMICDVATIVSAISQVAVLLPGDLVLTGSPAGNGAHWGRLLRDGDVMEGTITGLGTQRTRCVADSSTR